ncbi:SGNH/GDSL hydrolase family protein [Lyngbya sp. CCY1209]|uniref:SGNH/GDSL hydrolase family protein n=1 Tax=Lyngbya sp. CCY1209 TaxID=2886103 RepID=UPI002D20B4F0|nr:SGNH/GDSL hydrolase family protein [Lyngbya sp. CCY1209]MEB3882791.1 SGNH/GDSL hydrolase family protein [Lyngbya sp. CCY1209]
MVRILLIVVVGVLGAIALLEIGLRLLFGFGNPPIYKADEKIGYLLAPSQRTRRMGNRVEINEYSMRGSSLRPAPDPDTLRVMVLGDSIVNGGWWTDQDETIPAMMASLSQKRQKGEAVEVLNASANSWGPPNQLAYVRQFGLFDASTVVLVINTDDLFSKPPDPSVVGRDRNYPDRKPPLAIVEVFDRFAPSQPPPESSPPVAVPRDPVGYNLDAIREINAIATQTDARFRLAMTPLRREIGEPGPKDYELKARDRLKSLAETENIEYIDFLPIFNDHPQPETLYRDHIHLSPEGNRLVSDRLIDN